jgi:hypothetical protein
MIAKNHFDQLYYKLIGQKFNFPELQEFSGQSAATTPLSPEKFNGGLLVRFDDFCVENWSKFVFEI